jgi:hypothetical protein
MGGGGGRQASRGDLDVEPRQVPGHGGIRLKRFAQPFVDLVPQGGARLRDATACAFAADLECRSARLDRA